MTYSQLDYYSRAARSLELERFRVELAIMHNPYAKTAQDAKRLGTQFQDSLARLRGRASAGVPTGGQDRGMVLGSVARHLGGAKLERLTPEEAAARRARDEAARARTREMLERAGLGGAA